MIKLYFFECGLCSEISTNLSESVNGCCICKEGNPFMKNLGFVVLAPYVPEVQQDNLQTLMNHIQQCKICIEKGMLYCDIVQRIKGVVFR